MQGQVVLRGSLGDAVAGDIRLNKKARSDNGDLIGTAKIAKYATGTMSAPIGGTFSTGAIGFDADLIIVGDASNGICFIKSGFSNGAFFRWGVNASIGLSSVSPGVPFTSLTSLSFLNDRIFNTTITTWRAYTLE